MNDSTVPEPRPGRSASARLGAGLLAVALIAAACSDGDSATVADGGTASRAAESTAAEESEDGPGATSAAGNPTTTVPAQHSPVVPPTDDAYMSGPGELAFYWEPTTTTTAPTTTVPAAETEVAPQTTSGSGGAPVTTKASGGGVDLSIYLGTLGAIGPDDVIAPAVAPPPASAPGILPLTGLPGDVPNRPAAVVKIDNGASARPQTGLNAADIIVEEEVEGGITRLAAIFHSTPTIVGPVRSGRTTDIGIINGLGSPLLLYSGANAVTDALIRAQSNVQNRSASTSSGYWRNSSRRSPSNLYSDTAPHWASAAGGPPPPQFAYRADGAPVGGTDVGSFNVSYRASKAAWTWDGGSWLRTQGGSAHKTASGEQVSAANVVVIEAQEVPTGMVDSSGAAVPEFVFVGTGRATVFTAGKRIEGVWTRPTLRSVATLTTSDGTVIELTPGRTWIELIRADSGILN